MLLGFLYEPRFQSMAVKCAPERADVLVYCQREELLHFHREHLFWNVEASPRTVALPLYILLG